MLAVWTRGIPEDAKTIRLAVFVDEQGFPYDDEFDALDESAWHIVLYDNDVPLATGRIIEEKQQCFRLGRIVVHQANRKKGIGLALIRQMEEKAKLMGAKRFLIGSQVRAQGFYKKCGYNVIGSEYMDCHIPHIEMAKDVVAFF